MIFHRHRWAIVAKDVMGFYSKRQSDADTSYYRGTLEHCGCGADRLVPDNPDLRPVFVESGGQG